MWTARDLMFEGKIKDYEYRCPVCFKVLKFDEESEDEYLTYNGEIYHAECVDSLMKEKGVQYIKERHLREYIEWYYNLMFNDEFYPSEWEDNKCLDDIENVIQFICDDDDLEFLEWAENEI